jgi:hypothetical protein
LSVEPRKFLSLHTSYLKMEITSSSETSVSVYKFTRYSNPKTKTWINTDVKTSQPITMAARSKAWTVFARTRGMDVCVYSVCVVLCVGSGLAKGWSSSKETYRLWICLRNWKSDKDPKGCRAIEKKSQNFMQQTHTCYTGQKDNPLNGLN